MRRYDRFLYDYASENSPDLYEHLQLEEDEDFEEAKDQVYKDGYVMRDNLQVPHVEPVLSKPRNRDSLVAFVSKFIDEHSDELSQPGPVDIFTFGPKETQFLYDMFGIDADGIIDIYNKMVEETYYGKISKFFTGWVTNAPHKLLLLAMAVESVQKNYKDSLECVEYMYAFTEYPILYREFWKIGVREDVMAYTIENMGSKFKVKQVKNLGALLKYDATQSFENYADELRTGKDNVYLDLMQRIRNRMKDKFRQISRAYFYNIEHNATLHNAPTQFDDGTPVDQTGVLSNMAAIIDKSVNKITYSEVNNGMARLAADGAGIDLSNLKGMITQIYATKDNKIGKFVENVITLYFQKNPNTDVMPAGDFLNFGISLYKSIGVSKDPLLVEIKKIVKFWTDDIIGLPSMYDRQATITGYTKGIFQYFILMINHVQ